MFNILLLYISVIPMLQGGKLLMKTAFISRTSAYTEIQKPSSWSLQEGCKLLKHDPGG